ncbi:hypothetical protein R6Q59_030506 [Mikania micrantha]
MENLINLVNKLQRACTALGDFGEGSSLPTLWDALPTIAVVGGQSSGKSSVLESVVGKDFLPRGSGIVTRRPLVLQLHRIDEGREYAEFAHQPRKRFTDFAAVRKEISDETDRETGRTKQISSVPIYLSIYSPNVVNLTLVDLPGLTKVAVEGQSDSIVQDIENMVRSYIEKPNCIILAVSPANQDLATSDAIKIAREVDPQGERTFGVLTKIDLMDKGTDAVDMLEGKSYKLKFPWIGVVNRSQADINKSVDMIAARRREREYFANTPEYRHLASRMGSEHLGKVLSKHLETVIKSRIPGLQSLINKTIIEIETELSRLGKPIATDAGGKLYMIMEICRAFDQTFKEHLDGIRPGGDKVYSVFDNQLPAALKRLQFDKQLSMENVRKLITEADGYQPHLIAPEQGYRRLIESTLITIKGPAEAAVDAVHGILKDLVHKSINETAELKQYPSLRAEVMNAACESLDKMRNESKRATIQLVDMECAYLTVDFFRKLPQDIEKGGNPTHSIFDRYNDSYLRRIGSNVLSYIHMVVGTLRHSIPKSVVYCQVREAKRSLLDHFFTELGAKEGKQLAKLLDEDPAIMQRRMDLGKRLELYKSAQTEVDAVAWAKDPLISYLLGANPPLKQVKGSIQLGMGMKKYVVEIEKAKEGSGDRSSVGPVYRNVLGCRPLPDALHSCWDVFRSSVENYPDNPMLGQREITDGKAGKYVWLTYKEVYETVLKVGDSICSRGIKKGARCGIYGTNCTKWVVSMQVLKTLPDTGKYLKTLVSFSTITNEQKQMAEKYGLELYPWEIFLHLGSKDRFELPSKMRSDICTIMYTSGTTGEPKGVMITNESILSILSGVNHHLQSMSEEFRVSDVYFSYLPLAHIFDRVIEELFISTGASIGFWRGDIKLLIDDLKELKPTVFCAVPRVLDRIYSGLIEKLSSSGILKQALFKIAYSYKLHNMRKGYKHEEAAPRFDKIIFSKVKEGLGGKMRLILSGAAPLSACVETFLRVVTCAHVLQGYGLTESCAGSFVAQPNELSMSGTVGPPLPNVDVCLMSVPEMGYNALSPASPRGEILLRGTSLFSGYYKRQDLTKEVLIDGWFHTGDIGEWQPDGSMKIIDRKKNIFKLSQGEYVSVENLESIFSLVPCVDAIWIYGNSFKSFLVAVVNPNKESLESWAAENGVPDDDFRTICENPNTNQYILGELTTIAKQKKLKGFEFVKVVHLDPLPFDMDRDLLTPTFKKKRANFLKYYQNVVDGMYHSQ